jgi:hypothetical protein
MPRDLLHLGGQVKQKDKAGRPDIDAFEAPVGREDGAGPAGGRERGVGAQFGAQVSARTTDEHAHRRCAESIHECQHDVRADGPRKCGGTEAPMEDE